jgi:hypothetical protein
MKNMKKLSIVIIISLLLATFMSISSFKATADPNDNLWIGATTEVPTSDSVYRWNVSKLTISIDYGPPHLGSDSSEDIQSNAIGVIISPLDVQHTVSIIYEWNSTYTTTRLFNFILHTADVAHNNFRWVETIDAGWWYLPDSRILTVRIDGPQVPSIFDNISISFADPVSFIFSIGRTVASIIYNVAGWDLHAYDFTIGMVLIFGFITGIPSAFIGGTSSGGTGFRIPYRSSGGRGFGSVAKSIGYGGKRRGRSSGSYNWLLMLGIVLLSIGFLAIVLSWIIPSISDASVPIFSTYLTIVCLLVSGVVISIIGIKRRD